MNTVDELIMKGEQLEKDRTQANENSTFGKFRERHKSFNGVCFQEWISKSIFYLEEQKPNSLVTETLREKYKNLRIDTSYEFYEVLLGALKAIKNQ